MNPLIRVTLSTVARCRRLGPKRPKGDTPISPAESLCLRIHAHEHPKIPL